jgi:hypothetical protein
MKRALPAVAFCLGTVILTACSLYRAGQQQKNVTWFDASNGKYSLGIIEFDDQGWLFNPDDAGRVLKRVEQEAQKGGTNIVVFVHGWHHNAACGDPRVPDDRHCDDNLECFRRTLERVDDELQLPIYQSARQVLFGSPDSRVVGVYLAWRGASLPGNLDYVTFWDRKEAAIRVGHGDVTGVLARLADIYDRNNPPDGSKYTGLVVAAHSFGGQVVYAAVSDILKARIAEQVGPDGNPTTINAKIRGFGDLVVLINPALEASVYEPIDRVTRHERFSPEQGPVLMVVSSEGDWPNRDLFPVGRHLSIGSQPYGPPGQYQQKVHSLGNVKSQVTHCLIADGEKGCDGFPSSPSGGQLVPKAAPAGQASQSAKASTSACPLPPIDAARAAVMAGAWTLQDLCEPTRIQLAGMLEKAATRFYPVDPAIDPNEPFVVVKATRGVIRDHNDMFDPVFIEFLVRYVGGTQLKRVALMPGPSGRREQMCRNLPSLPR